MHGKAPATWNTLILLGNQSSDKDIVPEEAFHPLFLSLAQMQSTALSYLPPYET